MLNIFNFYASSYDINDDAYHKAFIQKSYNDERQLRKKLNEKEEMLKKKEKDQKIADNKRIISELAHDVKKEEIEQKDTQPKSSKGEEGNKTCCIVSIVISVVSVIIIGVLVVVYVVPRAKKEEAISEKK